MNKLKSLKNLRAKLLKGEPSIGSWMQIPNSSIAEILGDSGYDWVAVDLEHGAISLEKLPDLYRALEINNTLPLARIADVSKKDCKEALDSGAAGLIIPMIQNSKDLKKAIKFSCWPPKGNRGVGYSRANLFGKYFNKYMEEAQNPFIVAMIENEKALSNIEEIIQVEGLDAILIGPYDLSSSLGAPGDFKNINFINAKKKILNIASEANIPCGLHQVIPDLDMLNELLKDGFTFIPYSIDSVFLEHISRKPKHN